jgi:hypothetical protein
MLLLLCIRRCRSGSGSLGKGIQLSCEGRSLKAAKDMKTVKVCDLFAGKAPPVVELAGPDSRLAISLDRVSGPKGSIGAIRRAADLLPRCVGGDGAVKGVRKLNVKAVNRALRGDRQFPSFWAPAGWKGANAMFDKYEDAHAKPLDG